MTRCGLMSGCSESRVLMWLVLYGYLNWVWIRKGGAETRFSRHREMTIQRNIMAARDAELYSKWEHYKWVKSRMVELHSASTILQSVYGIIASIYWSIMWKGDCSSFWTMDWWHNIITARCMQCCSFEDSIYSRFVEYTTSNLISNIRRFAIFESEYSTLLEVREYSICDALTIAVGAKVGNCCPALLNQNSSYSIVQTGLQDETGLRSRSHHRRKRVQSNVKKLLLGTS